MLFYYKFFTFNYFVTLLSNYFKKYVIEDQINDRFISNFLHAIFFCASDVTFVWTLIILWFLHDLFYIAIDKKLSFLIKSCLEKDGNISSNAFVDDLINSSKTLKKQSLV